MATATKKKRIRGQRSSSGGRKLVERVAQSQGGLRVTRGGKPITLQEIDSSNEWRSWPGEVVIYGVRILNQKSKNGVFYSDGAVRDVARIHESHDAAWEHEDAYNNQRPVRSRFGFFKNGRVIEEAGAAISAEADLVVFEGDEAEVNQLIIKALRRPSAQSFSIESDEGQWTEGEPRDDGLTEVAGIQEMLDTAAVGFGGTTHGLSESDKRKQRKPRKRRSMTMSERALTEKLLREAKDSLSESQRKLQEECGCHKETKDELSTAQAALAAAEKARDDALAKIEELEGGIQESANRDKVRKLADEKKVKLSESDVSRYSKFSDEELTAQLEKDGKLQESSGGNYIESAPTGGSNDGGSNDIWEDDLDLLNSALG